VGWILAEVEGWVHARIGERDRGQAKDGATMVKPPPALMAGTSRPQRMLQPLIAGFPCSVAGTNEAGGYTYSYRYSVDGAWGEVDVISTGIGGMTTP
jgi:hypothetical protein